ncbi:hypothetical protein Tco_1075054 [Tanacetum coccineum]
MSESSELSNESYVFYDRVMNPLTAHQEQKTRKDRGTIRGRHSTSSSSAFDQPSSSHLNDDDDGDGEGTSRASTPSPIRFVNSLTNDIPQVFSTWMAFRGNTRDLGSFGEEIDEITDLHQILEELLLTKHGDGAAGIK